MEDLGRMNKPRVIHLMTDYNKKERRRKKKEKVETQEYRKVHEVEKKYRHKDQSAFQQQRKEF